MSAREQRAGVDLTNLDQPLSPDTGATKRDLVDYLDSVADLAARAKRLESGTPQQRVATQKHVKDSQQDPDLASVRDAAALAKLPEAERVEWNKLWAEVEALLKKADEGAKK